MKTLEDALIAAFAKRKAELFYQAERLDKTGAGMKIKAMNAAQRDELETALAIAIKVARGL